MKKSIWKFPLEMADEQVVFLPIGAKFLSVQMQEGTPCIWAEVNTTAVKKGRIIQIFGTGHDTTDAGDYISTFQMCNGRLVFHVFIKS